MRRHLLQETAPTKHTLRAPQKFETLGFQTAEERTALIIKEAEYFTACRIIDRKRERHEASSIEGARALAKAMLAENGIKPILIYAVSGIHDTYVETIKGESHG